MMMRSTARSALAAAAALSSLLVLVPGSHAASTVSSDNDSNNLRGRPVGVSFSSIDQEATPSSSFGRVLQNILNTSEEQYNEDLDAHYPLYLTNNERTEDDYDINDVLLSFTIRNPSSDVMRQPPGRKLAEAALADDAHAEDAAHEEGEGDAHDMVVHVTYENIYAILVFLLTATAFGIVTSKLGMPALVGEIIAGFLLGPPLADFVPYPKALVLVGEIGLILLLLEAGVELDVAQLRETGTKALGIGVTGTILPLVVGMGLAIASDANMGIKSALAVGASFSPTSLGVAASALKQGKMLDTPVGQLIVSSCVVDDILALILLSMFQVLVEENPPIIAYFIPFISSLGFLLVLGGSAVTWLPKFIQNKILNKVPEQHRELTMFSIMTAMLLAYLPLLNYTKSSYLTGAFLAGATFSQIESAPHAFIKTTHQLMTWLLRVFFAASIGFQVPVKLFSDPYVIGWGFILYACVLAKFPLMFYVPQFEDVKEGASYNPFLRDRLITGLAMTCRGEFSFIIAAFALGKGLITAKIYAAIVWAVLLSCITSPFILLSLIKYFNKQQLEYLKATNPSKQKTGYDGMTPLYLHIKSTAPASWGQQEVFRKILNDMNLEVIDRRTNRHGRSLAAEVQTDLYVKDKTMNIKFQKIAGQRRIKNALKAAMDLTMNELDEFSSAIDELQKLVDDDSTSFFMQFDSNGDGVVSIGELKEGLEKKLSLKLTQRQARKVMDLFDESQDGYLQEDEMVSLAQFRYRLQALTDGMKSNAPLDVSTKSSEKPSLVRRVSTVDLSHMSLVSLEKEAQTALEEVAKEQDQVISRGTAIEESMEKALGDASKVVVDVWNPWPWTELFEKIASHYELETVDHFVAVFASIDIDGGGTVDQDEIFEALLQAGVDISEEGVATLFNMIDEDGSGEIDEEEWKEAADFYLELKEEEKEMARKEEDTSKAQERLRAQKIAKLGAQAKALKQKK
mmetsp:Transcript_12655/g.25292  ORF Transcript_12655/g.25292 Transcript_12655/m.25292 type:complete len:967 (+) Transcript_12655:195-3095(+)